MSDAVLLLAKLAPPPGPACFLERPQLRHALDHAAARTLTFLIAPAGWGKTTLLRSWPRTMPGELGTPAWLSVEPGDRGGQFRAYLHDAVRGRRGAATGRGLRPHLLRAPRGRPQPPVPPHHPH